MDKKKNYRPLGHDSGGELDTRQGLGVTWLWDYFPPETSLCCSFKRQFLVLSRNVFPSEHFRFNCLVPKRINLNLLLQRKATVRASSSGHCRYLSRQLIYSLNKCSLTVSYMLGTVLALRLQHKSCVADKVLVLWPGIRPEPLRWESQVPDIAPAETSWPQVISISESYARDLRLNGKTQLHPTNSKLQCWMPHAKQLAR